MHIDGGALVVVKNLEPEGGSLIVVKTRYLDGLPTMMGDKTLAPGERARFILGRDEKLHVIKVMGSVSQDRAARMARRREARERARSAREKV